MQSKDFLKELGTNTGNLGTNIDKIYNSTNNLILFGPQGSGKTTLLKKLCGGSIEINPTKVPQFAESSHKGDFLAIDFPTFDSEEDQLIIYKINKTILSKIPIKAICFVVKYENRFDLVILSIFELKNIFEGYEDNTIIIVTQCENTKYIGNLEKQINQLTKFKRVFFSYKNKDNETLLYDKLIIYMSKMKTISNMMIKTINLIDFMHTYYYNLFLEEKFNFLKMISLFEEKSNEFKNNPEVQRALFFAFKSYKNKFLKKLCKSTITNEMTFCDIDKLVLELISFCKIIKKEVFHLISLLKVGLQFGIKNEIDKGIKKCPNCGILWTKFYGSSCIRCGNRGNSYKDYLSIDLKNYRVKLFDDKIIVEEDNCHNKFWNYGEKNFQIEKPDISGTVRTNLNFPTNPLLLKKEEKERNKQIEKENKSLIKPIGCTFHFYWYEVEDVTKEVIDLLNNNLINDYTDYYSDAFEIGQELKIKAAIDEIKKKLINAINNDKNISYILEIFESFEKFKLSHPENLDLIVEYSSITKDSEDLKNNLNKKDFIHRLIELLYNIGYYNIEY